MINDLLSSLKKHVLHFFHYRTQKLGLEFFNPISYFWTRFIQTLQAVSTGMKVPGGVCGQSVWWPARGGGTKPAKTEVCAVDAAVTQALQVCAHTSLIT